MEIEPWAGVVLPVTLRLVPASLPNSELLLAVPAGVAMVSLVATGVTLSNTVAVEVLPNASVVV